MTGTCRTPPIPRAHKQAAFSNEAARSCIQSLSPRRRLAPQVERRAPSNYWRSRCCRYCTSDGPMQMEVVGTVPGAANLWSPQALNSRNFGAQALFFSFTTKLVVLWPNGWSLVFTNCCHGYSASEALKQTGIPSVTTLSRSQGQRHIAQPHDRSPIQRPTDSVMRVIGGLDGWKAMVCLVVTSGRGSPFCCVSLHLSRHHQ